MGKSRRSPSRKGGNEPTKATDPTTPTVQPVQPVRAELGASGAFGMQASAGNAHVAGLIAEQGDGGHATADADDDSNSPRMCVEQPAEKCRCPSALREYAFPCSRGADIVGM